MSLNTIKKIVITILNYFIGTLLIVSGLFKIAKHDYYVQMLNDLNPNYTENIVLLGIISLSTGLLLILPRTFIFGFIGSLVFLGGTIGAHMQHDDSYLMNIILILILVVIAFYKIPQALKLKMTS